MTAEAARREATRLVLVEDHPRVREFLVNLLHSAGLDVVAAVPDAATGYTSVTRLRPDIAVIDNRLPDGRGVDLCERLVRAAPATALIVHSGAVTAAETERALSVGVCAVVPKSLRGNGLLEAVHLAARQSRQWPPVSNSGPVSTPGRDNR